MNAQLEIRKLMRQDLLEAQLKNPAYSLRAFARKLDLYSSALSEILNGKRQITLSVAEKILDRMGVAPEERGRILKNFQGTTRKRKSKAKNDIQTSAKEFVQLNMDQFHVVSDWQYFAVLSLADTDNFKGSPEWVAQRLNIKPQDARIALERLERLGLLKHDKLGNLVASGLQFQTTSDVPNLSLRKHHYQNLDLARKSLDQDEITSRDFSFITMAVDPKKLPEVKERIKKFRRELCEFFESGSHEEVYKLCIQLFPLTELKKKEGELK